MGEPISMRVGGRYRLRNGAEVECMKRYEITGPPPYVFFTGGRGSGLSWNERGRYAATDIESGFDVVAEIESDGRAFGT